MFSWLFSWLFYAPSIYKLVVLDGLIGCGKSTATVVLKRELEVRGYTVFVVDEPVELWKKSGRLEMFYTDKRRRSFQFQVRAFHDRIVELRKVWEVLNIRNLGHYLYLFYMLLAVASLAFLNSLISVYGSKSLSLYTVPPVVFGILVIVGFVEHLTREKVIVLMERSIFSDHIFAEILHQDEDMDSTELEDYESLRQMWVGLMPVIPDLFVFLRPDLDIVMARMRGRGRPEESGVSVDYQVKLLEGHDRFYAQKKRDFAGKSVPMHVINTNYDYRDDHTGATRLVRELIDAFFI